MKDKEYEMRGIKITGEHIKLDSLLKFAAIASTGGEAKILIQNGDVMVDDKVCTSRGKKIIPGAVVKCCGEAILVK